MIDNCATIGYHFKNFWRGRDEVCKYKAIEAGGFKGLEGA